MPTPTCATVPSSASSTRAATPTMANPEAGWCSLTYESPARGGWEGSTFMGSTGTRTAVRISSAASAVVIRSTKKSSAGIQRSPREEAARISESSARTAAGQSAAGSAWARLPPSVPLLRTWASPISLAASGISGHFAFSNSEDSIWKCVVRAPISTLPSPSGRT